ncbi:hypothetical protein [Isoptericola sp. NPDC056605]|uniref:hypothetical protein n=1 Tax=Isoptericola sp. NPDC056605 TaxID=3345876 RepID=UPI0036B18A92
MSTIDRIMHALGWQRVQEDQRPEAPVLAELRGLFGTQQQDTYLAFLEQTVQMAKAGALLDLPTLDALCHLAATRCLTPATVQALHHAGIDTTPWPTTPSTQDTARDLVAQAAQYGQAVLDEVEARWPTIQATLDAVPPGHRAAVADILRGQAIEAARARTLDT